MTTLDTILLLVGVALIVHGPKLASVLWSRAKKLRAPSPAVCGIIAACIVLACMLLGCAGIGYVIGSGWKVVPVPPGPPTPDVVVPPDAPAVKILRATYVFEKDDGGVPSGVRTALDKLNRQGIIATDFEDDTKDASGDVPEQYKIALAEAQKASLPAFVVEGDNGKVKVVKKPTTEAECLEAAKP